MFYVYWLFGQGKLANGIQQARDLLSTYPELARPYIAMMDANADFQKLIPQTLPERVQPYLAYAHLLVKRGNTDEAASYYNLALSCIDREEQVHPEYFNQPLHFFRRQKDDDSTFAVLKMAVNRLPNDFGFHLMLGDYYVRQGLNQKALEEYRAAQSINPIDQRLQQRMENLLLE
nr:hypothetical protein [uncultured Desulfobulbus sp.]